MPGPVLVKEIVKKIVNSNSSRQILITSLSTIDFQKVINAGEKCKLHGINYIEALVNGGSKGAETGVLSIIVDANKSDFQQIEPFLNDIGKNIFYLGEIGTASIGKISNNILVSTNAAILSEAYILASGDGIELAKLKEVLENSVGGSRILGVFGDYCVLR